MNFNWVDITVAVFLILSVGRGFLRGFIRSVFDMLAILLAVFIAFTWYGQAAMFIGRYIKIPENFVYIVGFSLTWAAIYFLTLLAGSFLHKIFGHGLLGPLNSFGGALIGAAKGLLVLWLVLYFIEMVPIPKDISAGIDNAQTIAGIRPVIKTIGDGIFSVVPNDFGFAKEYLKYENEKKVPAKKKKDTVI